MSAQPILAVGVGVMHRVVFLGSNGDEQRSLELWKAKRLAQVEALNRGLMKYSAAT
jgi:hypothetical protein